MSRGEVPKSPEEQQWQNILDVSVDLKALFGKTAAYREDHQPSPFEKLQAALGHMGGDFSNPPPKVAGFIADLIANETIQKTLAQRELTLGDILPFLGDAFKSRTNEFEYLLYLIFYTWAGDNSIAAFTRLSLLSSAESPEDKTLKEKCETKIDDVVYKINERFEQGRI